MNKLKKQMSILVADDDPDDREMIRDALKENRVINVIQFVQDGEELMDFLHHRGAFQDEVKYPRPCLIILDLNMPRMNGREALREIKRDSSLRLIPVVVLTTSQAEEDIYSTYELGANSFVTKPVTFDAFVQVMKTLGQYWFEIVELPDLEQKG